MAFIHRHRRLGDGCGGLSRRLLGGATSTWTEPNVERSLEETKEGRRFKAPKTKRSRGTICRRNAVAASREHRRKHSNSGWRWGWAAETPTP